MKIGILGTRGIPNHYGGFEQLAEFLSQGLVRKGHQVSVYNSHKHPYKESTWRDVEIIHKYDPEDTIGTAGQFIYDLNCILDSRKRKFDAIINLGYTSSSVWSKFFPSKTSLITNMDGLEWKRTKYSPKVQDFLKYAETLAVKRSDLLIADSIAIQDYLKERYNVTSTYIPYGAEVFTNPDPHILTDFKLIKGEYFMLIARMEPENNIETILDGFHASESSFPFLVIGNYTNTFGGYLKKKYSNDSRIRFTGPNYDLNQLNNLRYYSALYFHGHSVGGTNPSLLEAMACHCRIAAHRNDFNNYILEGDALYFRSAEDVKGIIEEYPENIHFSSEKNVEKISNLYSWNKITDQYEEVLLKESNS